MADLVRTNIYRCKVCQWSFSRNIKLLRHMTSHSAEENLLYGDIFAPSRVVTTKEVKKRKQKIKKVRCAVCYKRVAVGGFYVRHLRVHHGITEVTNPSKETIENVKSSKNIKLVGKMKTDSIPSSSTTQQVKFKQEIKTVDDFVKPNLSLSNSQQVKRKQRGKGAGAAKIPSIAHCFIPLVNCDQTEKNMGETKIQSKLPKITPNVKRSQRNKVMHEIQTSETGPSASLKEQEDQGRKVVSEAKRSKTGLMKKEIVQDQGRVIEGLPSCSNSVTKMETCFDSQENHPKLRRKMKRSPKGSCVKVESGGKTYYECPECKRRFTHPSSLKAHRRVHSGERPYKCSVCFKSFTFYQCLWNHSWTHKPNVYFECDLCPKKYRFYQTLWSHYKVHSGEPLVCEVCKLTFTTLKKLNCHRKESLHYTDNGTDSIEIGNVKRSEKDQLPFTCNICSKSFKLNMSLLSHRKRCLIKQEVPPKNHKKFGECRITRGISQICQNQASVGNGFAGTSKSGRHEESISNLRCKGSSYASHYSDYTAKKKLTPSFKIRPLNISKQKEADPLKHEKNSPRLDVQNNNSPKNIFGNKNSLDDPQVRRKRQRQNQCKACSDWHTSTKARNQCLKLHQGTKPHKCTYCGRGYKSMAWLLVHQQLVHGDMGKKQCSQSSAKPSTSQETPKGMQHKCSWCGTVFLAYRDYKEHVITVNCVCGQRFHCGYIFCFHLSVCGGQSVPVREERGHPKAEGSLIRPINEEMNGFHNESECLNDSSIYVQDYSESPHPSPSSMPLVIDVDDGYGGGSGALSPGHDNSPPQGWCWQVNDSVSAKVAATNQFDHNTSKATHTSHPMPDPLEILAKPSHSSHLAAHPSEILGFNNIVESNQGSSFQRLIEVKCSGRGQVNQCLICCKGFLSESELASHTLVHMKGLT